MDRVLIYGPISSRSVWVDGQDRLNLKLRRIKGQWHCAEVYSAKSLGYGRYIFYLDSRIDNLDSNVTIGLFVHAGDTQEIDIEFSKWGQERKYSYHQFVLQPRVNKDNIKRSDWRIRIPESTHGFVWMPHTVSFASYVGHNLRIRKPIKAWEYQGPNNPDPSTEKVHINLWLYQGKPPTDKNEPVLVVSRFRFEPLSPPSH